MLKRLYILILLMIAHSSMFAQQADVAKFVNGNLVMKISVKLTQQELDSILRNMNMNSIEINRIRSGKLDSAYLSEGWKIIKATRDYIEISKNIEQAKRMMDLAAGMHSMNAGRGRDQEHIASFYPQAKYGVNEFKNFESVRAIETSTKTVFILRNFPSAKKVYLSGSFNQWSTLIHPMISTDSGWVCSIDLGPGKHLYKFIVDGQWISDPENKLRESDTYHGYNSIYFKTNKIFQLSGYETAKRVVITGTFNDWNEREIQLKRKNGSWFVPMYLKEGTYSYKFIVDRNWILDPSNSNKRGDGFGNENSVLSIGDTTIFELQGFANAREVFVSGDFNAWNPRELPMKFENGKWTLPYVLAPGNYFYKYIVDGQWIIDPQNALSTYQNEGENSVKIVKPNYTFQLSGFSDAKDVRLSGSFINWSEPGLRMQRVNNRWLISVNLEPGKHLYKFIVDGKWMVDPDNPLYEENEHSTGNSFLWIYP